MYTQIANAIVYNCRAVICKRAQKKNAYCPISQKAHRYHLHAPAIARQWC